MEFSMASLPRFLDCYSWISYFTHLRRGRADYNLDVEKKSFCKGDLSGEQDKCFVAFDKYLSIIIFCNILQASKGQQFIRLGMGGPATVDGYVLVCTDNFYECEFVVDSLQYSSSQGYFQASKAKNEIDHNRIRWKKTGMEAWSEGSKVQIRPDWEIVKVRVMYNGNKQKFEQNQNQRQCLIETKGKFRLNEGFWGRWNCLILQRIRAEFRQNGEEDTNTIQQMQAKMKEYEEQQSKILNQI